MERSLWEAFASTFGAYQNCVKSGNGDWMARHLESLKELHNYLPHGSGFDSGTALDMDKSQPEKLVFQTAFHHMDEHGFYDGWTQHEVTLTPSFVFGVNYKISGRDRNEVKDLIVQSLEASNEAYKSRKVAP